MTRARVGEAVRKGFLGLGLSLSLAVSPAFAAFEDIGSGARPAGLGNSFVAIADDVHSIFYNPAGLATVERPQMLASHSLLHLGLSDGSNLGMSDLAFVKPLDGGKKGSVAAAWHQFKLKGVYAESSMRLAYGREVKSGEIVGRGTEETY